MGIVQFSNYLRPIQFVMHVCEINDELQLLDDMIAEISARPENLIDRMKFDCLSSSTKLYDAIEVHRETFGKIWKLHQSLCHCFGFSILVITLNGFLSATFTFYFSILMDSRKNSNIISTEFITKPLLHTTHIAILFVVMIYSCDMSDALVSDNLQLSATCSAFLMIRVIIGTRHQPPLESDHQECFLSANQRIFTTNYASSKISIYSSSLLRHKFAPFAIGKNCSFVNGNLNYSLSDFYCAGILHHHFNTISTRRFPRRAIIYLIHIFPSLNFSNNNKGAYLN